MNDFSSYEKRKTYYDNNQEKFDTGLEKMWRIWCAIELYESDFGKSLAQELKERSITKVWLNRKKTFCMKIMPEPNMLFKNFDWWLGQIVGKKNIVHEKERFRAKQEQQREEQQAKDVILKKMEPFLDVIVQTTIHFRKHSNFTMIGEWFKHDHKRPLAADIFDILIPSGNKGKELRKNLEDEFQIQIEKKQPKDKGNNISVDLKSNKKTLMLIAAHFRYYYLEKKIVKRYVLKKSKELMQIFEKVYVSKCPEGNFIVKDATLTDTFQKKSSEIKAIRKEAANVVLISARKDTELLNAQSTVLIDYILSKRVLNYKDRNIAEALRLGRETCLGTEEKENG